jgi:hypothetical protein
MLDGELHRLSELGSHIVAKIQRQVNRPDRPLDIWRLASQRHRRTSGYPTRFANRDLRRAAVLGCNRPLVTAMSIRF